MICYNRDGKEVVMTNELQKENKMNTLTCVQPKEARCNIQ